MSYAAKALRRHSAKLYRCDDKESALHLNSLRLIAGQAHARAVPAYAIPQRAESVLRHIQQLFKARSDSRLDA